MVEQIKVATFRKSVRLATNRPRTKKGARFSTPRRDATGPPAEDGLRTGLHAIADLVLSSVHATAIDPQPAEHGNRPADRPDLSADQPRHRIGQVGIARQQRLGLQRGHVIT